MLSLLRQNHGKKNIILDQEFHKDILWFVKCMPQFNDTVFCDPKPIVATLELDDWLTGLGQIWGSGLCPSSVPNISATRHCILRD